MKLFYSAILTCLFWTGFTASYAQIDGYFEHLDHFERRSFRDLLPVSQTKAYVWTGNELLQIDQDTIQSIYELSFGSGAISNFFTSGTDTTQILTNIFNFDVAQSEIIILKKNGEELDEFNFDGNFLANDVAPFSQSSYLSLTSNQLIHFDTASNMQVIDGNLSGNNIFASNNNQDVFLLSQDNQTNELVIYGTKDLELTVLYQAQTDFKTYQVSNDSTAYILSDRNIQVIDLTTGVFELVIGLDAYFGTDVIFAADETVEEFFVFSKTDQAFINRYDTQGNRELLFTDPTPNPQNTKICVQNNLVYTIGSYNFTGHYKVQENRPIEPTDRHDLQLNNLEVFFLGTDTIINIIPLNPPDTLISFSHNYEYTLEVENVDNETFIGYNTFSNNLRVDIPFDLEDGSFIDVAYFDPISPGEIQIQEESFITTLDIDFVNFTLEGIENMPDADYSNNFVIDEQFDLISSISDTQGLQNKVSIFPNPSRNRINFKTELDIYGVQIYGVAGQLQYAKLNQNPISDLELSNLPEGVYFIQLMDKKGELISVNKITKL